jgi:hypothetical protein
MKRLSMLLAGLLVLFDVTAAQDFACMQDCISQGYNQSRCITVCEGRQGLQGGMLDQPGVPRNPAFNQLQQNQPQQRPLPAVTDHKCMKDCERRGYNYMLCQKQCSYSGYGN